MKNYKVLSSIVGVLALVFANIVPAQPSADSRLTREQILAHPEMQGALSAFDAWIEGVLIYDEVPGISVGIVHDQDVIWSGGYGYSNLEDRRPADADTIYSICSISKLFTSIAVIQLRDRGELRLDDPVARHLDWSMSGRFSRIVLR